MSMKYLGVLFDVHCGGVDHIPVHHENEMAQSEAANGTKSVNYWMHGEFMMVENKRMGKSEGNAYLVDDIIEKGIDPLAYRYLNFGTHYRIQLNFTWEALEGADTALKRLRGKISGIKEEAGDFGESDIDSEFREKFLNAINNDLNAAEALSYVWDVLKSELKESQKLATIECFDRVLGLGLLDYVDSDAQIADIPDEVKNLLDKREKARGDRDYSLSDSIRDEIDVLGFVVKDTPEGQKLEKK